MNIKAVVFAVSAICVVSAFSGPAVSIEADPPRQVLNGLSPNVLDQVDVAELSALVRSPAGSVK
jgi:hypothetical protein